MELCIESPCCSHSAFYSPSRSAVASSIQLPREIGRSAGGVTADHHGLVRACRDQCINETSCDDFWDFVHGRSLYCVHNLRKAFQAQRAKIEKANVGTNAGNRSRAISFQDQGKSFAEIVAGSIRKYSRCRLRSGQGAAFANGRGKERSETSGC